MIQKIKLIIFRLLLAYYRRRLKRKGVEAADDTVINMMPSVRLAQNARIILHKGVTVTSNPRHNPLLLHPVQLHTVAPGAVIEMEEGSGISGSSIICCSRVSIGRYTIIGPNTLVYDSEGHSYTPGIGWKKHNVRTGRPITIGAECYIGANCIILSGVTIGNNCVISAGSVITEDVPAGHKASGNPATYTPLPKLLGGPGRKKAAKTA